MGAVLRMCLKKTDYFKNHLDFGRQTAVVIFTLYHHLPPTCMKHGWVEVVHSPCGVPSKSVVLGLFGKEDAGRRMGSTRAVGRMLHSQERVRMSGIPQPCVQFLVLVSVIVYVCVCDMGGNQT